MARDTRYIAIEATDSIAECFARRVAATPDAIAYRRFDAAGSTWTDITWRDASAAVSRVRSGLAAEILAPGDRVAIMLRNGPEWIYFDQAAHAEGLVVVPLYVDDRPDNIAYCLEDAGCRVLLVEGEEHLKKLADIRDRMPTVQRIVCVKACASDDARVVGLAEWSGDGGAERPRAKVDSDGLATIVYTSGTTGRPKGVMLSHQNMLQNVKSALAVYDVYPDDLFLSFLPLSHMLERTAGYHLTLVAGATVAFARSIAQLSEDFKAVRPTVIVSVPRIFERLHAAMQATLADAPASRKRLVDFARDVGWSLFEWHQKRGPWRASFLAWPILRALVAKKLLDRLGGRLRLCISGGAALSPEIARTFIGLGLPICQGYGLTETSPVVSVNLLERNDPSSIGVALPGVEIAFGENNVLLVKGPNVMLGYWKLPEATAKVKSATGWLDTGDQARLQNGFLYITGRIKDIIVLGNGEKVPPVDMELAIALDPLFDQVMIIGEGRPYLTAFVVLNKGEAAKAGDINEKVLAARIAAQLKSFPGYAQVRRVAVIAEAWTVDNGLLTPTLKLKRGPILEKYKTQVETLYEGRGNEMIHTETANHVQRIEIRRAEKKNALTHEMYTSLAAALDAAAADDSAHVVLLLGAPGIFTSGNDIADFLAKPARDDQAPVFQFLRRLVAFEKPIVAGVAGMAVGIGTTMLLHCDYVVASEDALFILPFVNLGLCPEAGSSVMLPLAIGHKRASEMLMFGDRVPAATALDWGMVNAVVPNDQLVAAAEKRAAALAMKPPSALRATKKLWRRTLAPLAAETLALEAKEFGALLHSPAAKECFAAFLEKRAPDPSKF